MEKSHDCNKSHGYSGGCPSRRAPSWFRPEKPPAITTPPNWCANCAAAGRNANFSAVRDRTCAKRRAAVIRSEDLSVVGIVEVLGHLPRIWRRFRELIGRPRAEKPDLAILTDSPDFHFPRRPQAEAARASRWFISSPRRSGRGEKAA